MSLFWPVDPDLAAMVPPSMLNELARFQMCGKVTVDFPDAWRANLVEVETERQPPGSDRHWDMDRPELEVPSCFRLEAALEEIAQRCAVISVGKSNGWLH